jgi:hypothetical protein
MKQRGKSDSGFPRIMPFSYPVGRVCFTVYFTVRGGGIADSLSTSRMTQQERQEESDQQEDRNEWFVNWNRPG